MPDNLEDQKIQDYIDAIINAKLNTEIPKLLAQNTILEARIKELETQIETLSVGGGDTSCCEDIQEGFDAIDNNFNNLANQVSALADRVILLEENSSGSGGGEEPN